MTGAQIARRMAPPGVTVTFSHSDRYDPATRNIHLCDRTAHRSDMAAQACAAHEAGHSVQHVTLRRSFRVWRSWPVRSFGMSVLGFASTCAAVLLHWHEWEVAFSVVGITLARIAVILWIEAEASHIAANWLLLHKLERVGTRAYLRMLGRSYLALALGF
jgi:Zn-dependent membrane protease YugP